MSSNLAANHSQKNNYATTALIGWRYIKSSCSVDVFDLFPWRRKTAYVHRQRTCGVTNRPFEDILLHINLGGENHQNTGLSTNLVLTFAWEKSLDGFLSC